MFFKGNETIVILFSCALHKYGDLFGESNVENSWQKIFLAGAIHTTITPTVVVCKIYSNNLRRILRNFSVVGIVNLIRGNLLRNIELHLD